MPSGFTHGHQWEQKLRYFDAVVLKFQLMERKGWPHNPDRPFENYLSNVSVYLSENFGSRCDIDLLKKTLRFLDSSSKVLGNQFNNSVTYELRKKITNTSPLSLRLMVRMGLNLPQFRVFDSLSAKDYLHDWDLDPIEKGNLMIAYLMPPQISRFNHFKYEDGPFYHSTLDWGNVSHKTKKLMRKCANESAKHGSSLEIVKINNNGEHDSKRFHYLYEVSHINSNYFSKNL